TSSSASVNFAAPSHVLIAMGIGAVAAEESIRFTTQIDMDEAAIAQAEALEEVRPRLEL
ncbi:cysteine desulfurase NifS, partial [Mesorhizobium helmanticense]